MPYIGKEPEHGNYQLLDALTLPDGVFNGSRTVFNLTTDTVAVYPTSPATMIISLGGTIQAPNTAYTVSGNQITFASAPATSTVFFGISLGDTLDIGTPSDDSVTVAKMAANSVDSDQYVDGSIDLAHMSANSIDSDQYVDGSIDLAHMSANSIDSDQYVDGSIDGAHIANDAIDSQHYAAGSIDLEHMSSESVDEDNLHISNAGSNGQYLSKQSGNAGGLTWAAVSAGASIASGNFSGDAASDQSITGLGFSPVLVMISKRCASASCGESMAIAWKNAIEGASGSGDGRSGTWWAGYNTSNTPKWEDDGIRSVDADGFTVGNTTVNYLTLNGSGNVYTWVAIG